jgi:hypothetical protein
MGAGWSPRLTLEGTCGGCSWRYWGVVPDVFAGVSPARAQLDIAKAAIAAARTNTLCLTMKSCSFRRALNVFKPMRRRAF